jgi:hypothetical protein
MLSRRSWLVIGIAAVLLIGTGGIISCTSEPQSSELLLSDYPELFRKDAIIVVGANASQMELGSAQVIIEKLEELSGNEPMIKNDGEVSENDKSDHNLVLLGTPDSNDLLQDVYDATNATSVTTECPGRSKGILEILRNPWNSEKALLIVAGSDEWGVMAGAASLLGSQQQGGNTLVVEWEQSEDKSPSYLSKIDATLDFLLYLREQDEIPEAMKAIVMKDTVSVSIKFTHELGDSEIHSIEELGVIFKKFNGDVAHSGAIYGADVPWHKIHDLAELESIVRIESTWLPGMEAPDG